MNQQYKRYSDEADKLSQGVQTPQTRARLQFLLSAMSTLREFGMNNEMRSDEEHRAAKYEGAFNRYLRGGDAAEIRTYAAMTTAGVPIPQGFMSSYVEKLKSFSGIRQVANIVSTSTGDSLKNPFSDDSANTGERLNENDPVGLANPTFNSTNFVAYRYSSKGLKYSAQLLQDAGIDVGEYLQDILSKRIGRITNQEFTLGGSGAMTGVIPSITQIIPAANTNFVLLSELVSLQSLDAGYLSGSVYMFSSSVERILKGMTASGSNDRLFPEMNDKKLLGYDYVLNVDMPSTLSASGKAIIFGNFKHAVTIREVIPSLLVSRERFAEQNLLYASLRHDQDCQVVSPDALNVLQMHA